VHSASPIGNAKVLAQEGRTHEVIVNRAYAQPADLLVMGTHGRSGFNRLLLGSVTEQGAARA
jgi:nucleotide-binding universal stress UspA family protein